MRNFFEKAVSILVRTIAVVVLTELLTIIAAIDGLVENPEFFGNVCLFGLLVVGFMFLVAFVLPLAIMLAMEIVIFFAKRRAKCLLPEYRRPALIVAKTADTIGYFAAKVFVFFGEQIYG